MPWSTHVLEAGVRPIRWTGALPIGVLPGEGVGPAVVAAAVDVLEAVAGAANVPLDLRAAPRPDGACVLSPAFERFCRDLFAAGGGLLAGAVGGRFVYDLRTRFDLFCKLVPLRPSCVRAAISAFRPEHVDGVDVLLVRENVGGVYQGEWALATAPDGQRRATHAFAYDEQTVRRIVTVATRLATARRGRLVVVLKEGGVPAASALWRAVTLETVAGTGVHVDFANVDLVAYGLVQEPRTLDVVVAPNLLGDVLADVGAVLLGGRGASFSGNFAADGAAVYQTNHGAAFDLAGTDQATPVGQIMALAMCLRETAGLPHLAAAVETALDEVWSAGWRAGGGEPSGRIVGTRALGRRVAEAAARLVAGTTHEPGVAAG